MALQNRLPLLPADAKELSPDLAVVRRDNKISFFNASGPIYECMEDDKQGIRIASAVLAKLKLAHPNVIAETLNIDRSSVYRNKKILEEFGIAGLQDLHGKNREAYKLNEEKLREIQDLLDKGLSNRKVAKIVGVSEGAIRAQIKKNKLIKPEKKEEKKDETSQGELFSPSTRTEEDQKCSGGVAVKWVEPRAQARAGRLEEKNPEFVASEAVPKAGVLLALGAILDEGLIPIGEKIYEKLQNGYYGLNTILLVLTFIALLRIKTIEQVRLYSPGELGLIFGLDRVPEVKTLRRKVKELGDKKKVSILRGEFLEYWATKEPETLGFLYIDGHVRPYNGRKHIIPSTHVPRRRLCMPSTTDFWVNDKNNDPIFVVTSEANNSLLSMINDHILPDIREVAGKERRITLIFDREGWSPETFMEWKEKKFDIITYRKGEYTPWPEDTFIEIEEKVCGKKVKYKLAEQSVIISKKYRFREIRRLCDDGHQTSVITTRNDLSMISIANKMFSRWRQENYFRYMRHEFAIDHLCTYDVDPANPQRLIPNPERKEKKKELDTLKTKLHKAEREYGESALDIRDDNNPLTMKDFRRANNKQAQEIDETKKQIIDLKNYIKGLPPKVPIKELLEEEKIVKLEPERKIFTDIIKMIAYRAETTLCNLIQPFFARHEDEDRTFIKKLFMQSADIIPDYDNKQLIIRIYGMPTPREQETLKLLCDILNEKEVYYPGTDLKLVYRTI